MIFLLVLLLAADHKVSRASTVVPTAEVTETKRIILSKKIDNDTKTIDNKQAVIEKPDVYLPNDETVKGKHHHLTSEEVYDKPKRERETDKDFVKTVIQEILSYDKFKHFLLRHNNGRKKHKSHLGIDLGYDENESSNNADAKDPTDSASDELKYDKLKSLLLRPRKRPKMSQSHYVLERHKRVPKQAGEERDPSTAYSFTDILIELLNILRHGDKKHDEVKKSLGIMAAALTKYLQQSKVNENDKIELKGTLVSNEEDVAKEEIGVETEVSKHIVNRIISEIKQLLSTHRGKSKLYVNRILDVITKNQVPLISYSDEACRKSKMEYLVHAINTVYQRYLTNSECEGEYLDTELDGIGWRSSNRIYKTIKRELASNSKEKYSSGEVRSHYSSKKDRLPGATYESSGEARLIDNFEDSRYSKIKKVKRLLRNDRVKKSNRNDELMSKDLRNKKLLPIEELESEEDKRDPNKELLDKYIKSRLLRTLRSLLVNKSDPYYGEIEKLFVKQGRTYSALDSIRQVCEKIASVQFLHSVEAIVWRLLQNTDCIPENILKTLKETKTIDPITLDITENQRQLKAINSLSLQDSSKDDSLDFSENVNPSYEKHIKYIVGYNNGDKNNKESNSKSAAIKFKLEKCYIPIYKISILKRKQKRFQDLTRIRKKLERKQLQNIFGFGKINNLKTIKQKLKDLNVSEYKKLINNIPVVEKLLKIIYNKLPPELHTVFEVLKPSVTKIMDDGNFSVKNLPSLIMEAFTKGKGKDLLEMMANKFKNKKLKNAVRKFKKRHDKTKFNLINILRKVSELHLPADNQINDSDLLVGQDQLKAITKPVQSPDSLPHVELSSSVEKNEKPVVELTYVINSPPVIIYKPKFYVKHNISYDQYLQHIKNIYNNDTLSTSNEIQLVKVIKKEGNVSEVFYEADIPNGPVEINKTSPILKLYTQFHNLNESTDKDTLSDEKNNKNDINKGTQRKDASNSIEAIAKEISYPSNNAPFINLSKTNLFKPKSVGSGSSLEETANNILKNYEVASQQNESTLEESAEMVNNITIHKPPLKSEVVIDREGTILRNKPIDRPNYSNRHRLNRKRKAYVSN